MKYSSRQQPTNTLASKIDWILIALIMILAIISVTTISSAIVAANIVPIWYSSNYLLYFRSNIALIVMIFLPKIKIIHIYGISSFVSYY